MANLIAGVILFLIGGFMAVCTSAMIRFQVWSQRAMMGAQYIPSQRTYTVMRIIGAILLIIGILVGISTLK